MAESKLVSSILKRHGLEVESLRHLTDDLDLDNLPQRLDDQTLDRVENISRSPLPPPIPADEKHFIKCLRIMLAVLPRQAADELSGELFVAAYQRKLGHFPDAGISFLADKAMERCRWFPTIAECLEILSDWRRDDDETRKRNKARQIANSEKLNRQDEAEKRRKLEGTHWQQNALTQEFIDELPPQLISLGLKCKTLRENDEGKVVEWFDDPADNDPPFAA